MVHDVVAGLQGLLNQEKVLTDTHPVISEPKNHLASAVQNTQQQLVEQLNQIQTTMKAMQLQHDAAPQPTHKYYGGRGYYGG